MISIKNLTKEFSGQKVLDGIDIDIEKGEVVALVGASGAGKSTILRSLNYLEQPDSGTIIIDDFKVDFETITKEQILTLRRKLAMVFQQFNLFERRTALDNVKEGLKIVKKLSDEEATKIAKEAQETGKGVYELVLEHDILSKEDLDTILKPENMNAPDTITASAGSFDLRDYEVARGQFFSSVGRISVSFSYKQISFNKDAIRKFPNIKFVELLIHPSSKLLAIRPCSSETKNKVQWSRLKDGQLIPKPISGAAFLPTLYEIFKWDKKCKYRILGVAHQKDNENVLIFNMDDTEIRIPTSTNDVSAPNNNMPDTISDSKSVLAYPADWMNSFGNNYYTQSQAPELTEFTADKNWQTASESKPYKEPELQTTPKETIIQNIKNIITEIKGDTQ